MAVRPATGLDTRTLEIALTAVEAQISLVVEGGPMWRPLVEEVEAAAQLEEAVSVREAAPPPAPAKPRRKRPRGQTSQVPAEERREQIVAVLRRHGGRMSPQEIKAEVPMSSSQGVSDFKKLAAAGKIRRHGPTTKPTYEAVAGADAGPITEGVPATLGGRMMDYLGEHGKTTEEALAGALGATAEAIKAEVGSLMREGEVRYVREGGETFVAEDPSAG